MTQKTGFLKESSVIRTERLAVYISALEPNGTELAFFEKSVSGVFEISIDGSA